ncbi:unnamed protein product [Tilletia laevis]|uniref:Deacetylase sirtuin-type domain-containing protein n=2 Tax=Tilletia TaxID=13289 RepID=A0A177UWJ5_9BASI|nr:hypothetical protein CF336_g2332 [Tilletia laevis]KAE8263105.1 hypothetical protein A4X03_0g1930 [Tilletia caries]KAE8206685.1 hypothetical protein CF335_g1687 [Tilletia laevis]CAD6890672.1 unnamed protein product [Tilletia caries]CAD6917854.1 unnamed protein product [Tilletia laevis]
MPKALRISIPSIPLGAIVPALHPYAIQEAAERIAEVLTASRASQGTDGRPGRSLILTGAGISVDSGIAPYRGRGGHYEVHKSYRPIYYAEFSALDDGGHRARQRYWNRSFLGFPPVRYARPNPAHMAIAAMQRMGYVPDYITQNVDSLHHSATPSPSLAAQTILELHGTLQHVVCIASPSEYTASLSPSRPDPPPISSRFRETLLSYPPPPPLPNSSAFPTAQSLHNHASSSQSRTNSTPPEPVEYNTPSGKSAYPLGCGFRGSRAAFQDELARLNPKWEEYGRELMLGRAEAAVAAAAAHGEAGEDARGEVEGRRKRPKMNPDGDVDLGDGVDYTNFKYPSCPNCGGVLKPAVIFFGETVPTLLKDRATSLVEQSSSMLVVGSSLATYSAFRLIKQALDPSSSSSSSDVDAARRQRELMVLNIGPTRADPLLSLKAKMELGSTEVLTAAARLLAGGREKEDPVLRSLLEGGEVVRRDGNASSKVVSS